MGSGGGPHLHSRQQQPHGSVTQLHQAIPCPQDEASSPQYTTPNSSYSLGPQHELSPMSQGMPGAFLVGDGRMWDPSSGVRSPPVGKMGVDSRGSRGKPAASAGEAAAKSKRVRTGCLTCRERHLKCDEGLPECHNCRKSNRECRRGLRLNFIDVQVKNPPCLPRTADWSVQIVDESRSIASEYKGGLGRYPEVFSSRSERDLDARHARRTEPTGFQKASSFLPELSGSGDPYDHRNLSHPNDVGKPPPPGLRDHEAGRLPRSGTDNLTMSALPTMQVGVAALGEDHFTLAALRDHDPLKGPASHGHDSGNRHGLDAPRTSPAPAQHLGPTGPIDLGQQLGIPAGLMTPSSEKTTGERDYLSSDDEIHFMQTFIDEVAIWMDALDKDRHFANTVPYLALKLPMLLNALLACGAKHLTLIGAHNGERADYYYGIAATQLLRGQQHRDRSLSECALTAVVLNAYDVMGDKPAERIAHIGSTRALIRECGWDASSEGLGAACFWVNVGMEVLSCISFGLATAWDPDQWGLNLEFANLGAASRSGARSVAGSDGFWGIPVEGQHGSGHAAMDDSADLGDEELWVHCIFYIMAKVANFRASTPKFQEPSPHDEQVRLQNRFAEWRRLQNMCSAWNHNCPRSVRPYGYSPGPSPKSLFPNVWLIKSTAKLGRLFYHSAMCLLAQVNPLSPRDSAENRASQLHHAHHVCGIIAHTRDRGVISIAIRSLVVVSAALVDRREQGEVISVLSRIARETGWRLGRVLEELKGAWGWEDAGTGSSSSSSSAAAAAGLGVLAPLPAAAAGLAVGTSSMRSGRETEGLGREGW